MLHSIQYINISLQGFFDTIGRRKLEGCARSARPWRRALPLAALRAFGVRPSGPGILGVGKCGELQIYTNLPHKLYNLDRSAR